mmetsp:Transcript_35821/g.66423  ORF Transcript_35821/g.66423 Transcript_35821/m.66423 type:complete len:423 (-) Transcript_35821:314-1582(-)
MRLARRIPRQPHGIHALQRARQILVQQRPALHPARHDALELLHRQSAAAARRARPVRRGEFVLRRSLLVQRVVEPVEPSRGDARRVDLHPVGFERPEGKADVDLLGEGVDAGFVEGAGREVVYRVAGRSGFGVDWLFDVARHEEPYGAGFIRLDERNPLPRLPQSAKSRLRPRIVVHRGIRIRGQIVRSPRCRRRSTRTNNRSARRKRGKTTRQSNVIGSRLGSGRRRFRRSRGKRGEGHAAVIEAGRVRVRRMRRRDIPRHVGGIFPIDILLHVLHGLFEFVQVPPRRILAYRRGKHVHGGTRLPRIPRSEASRMHELHLVSIGRNIGIVRGGQCHDGVEAISLRGTVIRHAHILQVGLEAGHQVVPPVSVVGRGVVPQFGFFRRGQFEDVDSVEDGGGEGRTRHVQCVVVGIVVDRTGVG